MALNISKDYLRLHFIVLIWGFTGILGKLIPLPATELVCYRMFWAAVGILAWALWKNKKLMLPLSAMLPIVGVGCIVALHWVTFFAAIKKKYFLDRVCAGFWYYYWFVYHHPICFAILFRHYIGIGVGIFGKFVWRIKQTTYTPPRPHSYFGIRNDGRFCSRIFVYLV